MTKYCKVVAVCFVWLVSVVCHICIACMFFYRGFCYCFVNGLRFTAVPLSLHCLLVPNLHCDVH